MITQGKIVVEPHSESYEVLQVTPTRITGYAAAGHPQQPYVLIGAPFGALVRVDRT